MNLTFQEKLMRCMPGYEHPLMIEDSPISYRLGSGLKRSSTLLVMDTIFEQSLTHLFHSPLLSLGGLALCYYLRDTVNNEFVQIRSEYKDSSHLSNIVRITLPLLGITAPLLALKTTSIGSSLTYQTISTLSLTVIGALSPVVTRYKTQIDDYFLDRMGMHISNLAQNEIFTHPKKNNDEDDTNVKTRVALEEQIKAVISELKEKGIHVQGDSVMEIKEVDE